jgi:hypothetical protein
LLRSEVRRALAGVVLAAAVATAGAAVVHGERLARQWSRPHWEDFRFFRHNREHVPSLGECFTSPPAWPGLYRPLSTSCYYYAGRQLFRNRIDVYHALNAAMFLANAVLLFVVARAALPGRWPLFATAAFVTRRAHAPLLVNSSEAQALLSGFFGMAALACELTGDGNRWRRRAAMPLLLAGLLCKETVIVVPAIVMVHRRLFAGPERMRIPVAMFAAIAAWGALFAVARHRNGDVPTGFTYDFSAALVPRLAAHLASFVNALTPGPAQVEMPEPVIGWAFSRVGIGMTVALVAATGVAVWRGPRLPPSPTLRAATFGFAWFVAGALPFLFFADRLFMRYGYFAHAGLSIAAAAAAAAIWRGLGKSRLPPPMPVTSTPVGQTSE